MCIYARDTLSVMPFNVDAERTEGVKDVWVKVQLCKLPSLIIVGRMCRQPQPTFTYISDVFKLVSLHNKSSYVLGDFKDDFFLLTTSSKNN